MGALIELRKVKVKKESQSEKPCPADHPFFLQQALFFDQNNGRYDWIKKSESEKRQSEKLYIFL